MGRLSEYSPDDRQRIVPAVAPSPSPWDRAQSAAAAVAADPLAVALVRRHPRHAMTSEQWEVLALLFAGELQAGGVIYLDGGSTRRISPYGRIVRPATEAALLAHRWIKPSGRGYVLTAQARAFVAGRVPAGKAVAA